jgi:hypothetical protein
MTRAACGATRETGSVFAQAPAALDSSPGIDRRPPAV